METKPFVRNISIKNTANKKNKYALSLNGYERSLVIDDHMKSCTFDNVEKPHTISKIKNAVLKDVNNGEFAVEAAKEQNP